MENKKKYIPRDWGKKCGFENHLNLLDPDLNLLNKTIDSILTKDNKYTFPKGIDFYEFKKLEFKSKDSKDEILKLKDANLRE